MKVFKPNLDSYSSAYFVAPPDEYELEIIKFSFRTRTYKDKNDVEQTRPIVSVTFRIVSGATSGTDYADKPVTHDFWLSEDERDWNNLLRFISAAKGIRPGTAEADRQLRDAISSLDFSIDVEEGQLGSGYASLVGARVRCNLSTTVAKNDPNKLYQKFGSFLPF
jgi:hypothetical protein